MRILLTGQTGFIGQHLLQALLLKDHQLSVIKRSKSTYETPSTETFRTYDRGELLYLIHLPIDLIIHCATEYNDKDQLHNILDCNLNLPLELMQVAAKHNIPFINTDSFYSKASAPLLLTRAYLLSKKQCFDWGMYFKKTRALTFINLRLEHVYGPKDNPKKWLPTLIQDCLDNKTINLTPGKQRRDFIYIDDVINAYLAILPHLVSEHYEVGTTKTYSIEEMVLLVKALTQSSSAIKTGAIPYTPHELMHSKANIDTLKQLGWMPSVTLKDGLPQTIQSMRDTSCLI